MGAYGMKNLGDDLLLEHALRLLIDSKLLDSTIVFSHDYANPNKIVRRFRYISSSMSNFIYNDSVFIKNSVKKEYIPSERIKNILNNNRVVNSDIQRFKESIEKVKIFWFIGGGTLNSRWRENVLYPTYEFCKYLLRNNKKYIFTGQTLGPFNSKRDEIIIQKIIDGSLYFTQRDRSKFKVPVVPDEASFTYSDLKEKQDRVTLFLHNWYLLENEPYLTKISSLISYLSGKEKLEVITINEAERDIHLIEALKKKVNFKYKAISDTVDFVRQVKKSKYVISTRFHPVVISLTNKIPVLAVTLDNYYSRKLSGIMIKYGQNKNIVRVEDIDSIYQNPIVKGDSMLSRHYSTIYNFCVNIFEKVRCFKENLKIKIILNSIVNN